MNSQDIRGSFTYETLHNISFKAAACKQNPCTVLLCECEGGRYLLLLYWIWNKHAFKDFSAAKQSSLQMQINGKNQYSFLVFKVM